MTRTSLARLATIGGLVATTSLGWALAVARSKADATTGPMVSEYGPVFDVSDPDFKTDLDRDYRVVFDVATSPSETGEANPSIETVARFLNMHARAGVPADRLHVALVLHGSAGKDALGEAPFRERFQRPNPNLDLLERLHESGVRVILCGQTAASREFERDELAEPVELALSAMTALVTLQGEGYQLIAF